MLLNGPVGQFPIADLGNKAVLPKVILIGPGETAPEPKPGETYISTARDYVWDIRLRVGGVTLSGWLTGRVEIDREEGAAAIASFTLFIEPGQPVAPPDWKGKAVSIDYISISTVSTEARRFTGFISSASWNPVTRMLRCECSDQRQQKVEGLSVTQIDALTPGVWSADIYEPVVGRSRWDYAMERMATVTGSLDCSPYGDLRVTSWYAKTPHFVFTAGTTNDHSVELIQSDLDVTTNQVEIEIGYRYSRLWQRNKNYRWQSPETQGLSGIEGFCQFRNNSHELPTKQMIEDVAAGNGEALINPVYYSLPPTMADPCGTGSPWINTFDDLLLGVSWVGARRWVQPITETYRITLKADSGNSGASVIKRTSITLNVDDERAQEWLDEPILGGSSGSDDLHNEARREAAITVGLLTGKVEIVSAHRETTLVWQNVTDLVLGVDLVHTLELQDQGCHAVGKCRRIVDSFDLATGVPTTTLSIAVMRGGGLSDQLIVPPRLGGQAGNDGDGDGDDGQDGYYVPLPTQLGGRLSSPAYDDTKEGFAGNYSSTTQGTEEFPRRIDAEAPEIPATDLDERKLEIGLSYRVGIPNDTLEL